MLNNPNKNIQKSESSSSVFTRSIKVATLAISIGVLSFGISHIGGTVSYYVELEAAINNLLRAGLVDITVTRMSIPESLPNPVGTDSFTLDVEQGPGSLPFSYVAHGELDPDVPSECGTMQVEAIFGSTIISGTLSSFTLPPTPDLGMWLFTLTIPQGGSVPPSTLCSGTFVFEASNSGYTDEASYAWSLTSSAAPVIVEIESLLFEPELKTPAETTEEIEEVSSTTPPSL